MIERLYHQRQHGVYHWSSIAIFALMAMVGPMRCRADLIIRIDDARLQAGSIGSVDVWVRSDASDTFSLVSYMLRIDPVAQVGGSLEFQPSFADGLDFHQNNAEQFDPNYLFAGNTEPSNFFAARQDPVRTRLVGTDESRTGNVTIASPTWYLLGRVELQHITPTPRTSHGTFRVSLMADPANSYFQNFDFDEFDPRQPKINPVSYSISNSGIITIASVPEPSSLLFFVSVLGIRQFRRSRQVIFVALSGDHR